MDYEETFNKEFILLSQGQSRPKSILASKKANRNLPGRLRSHIIALVAMMEFPLAVVAMVIIADLTDPS